MIHQHLGFLTLQYVMYRIYHDSQNTSRNFSKSEGHNFCLCINFLGDFSLWCCRLVRPVTMSSLLLQHHAAATAAATTTTTNNEISLPKSSLPCVHHTYLSPTAASTSAFCCYYHSSCSKQIDAKVWYVSCRPESKSYKCMFTLLQTDWFLCHISTFLIQLCPR